HDDVVEAPPDHGHTHRQHAQARLPRGEGTGGHGPHCDRHTSHACRPHGSEWTRSSEKEGWIVDQTPSRPDGMIIQPRDVGQILGAAFDLYKRNWQTLMTIAAVVLVPITIVQYFFNHTLRQTTAIVSQSGVTAVHNTAWR